MAIIRRTMENIRRMKPRINRAKIDATTEADIRRHMRADGQAGRRSWRASHQSSRRESYASSFV